MGVTAHTGATVLHRLTRLLASLGAKPGDTLCLEPAGRLAARASLVKASGLALLCSMPLAASGLA